VVASLEGRTVNLVELGLAGVYRLESPVWGDDRGFFREWFKLPDFTANGLDFHARQANLSHSEANVVRGLHYSLAPEGQAKVVTCVEGELDDVIVDIREGSPTFGAHVVVHLAAGDGVSVYLPAGVAHGFCVPHGRAGLAYLLSSPYNASAELEIHPFDPELAVAWTIAGEAVLSPKDAAAPSWAERRSAGQTPTFG
jgi:dTDP-4-dehydrorhamnose 3,5-epimerase